MRVGVNLLWLRPGQVGGTETYIRRVLRAVSEHCDDVEWHLFGGRAAVDSVRPAGGSSVAHLAPDGFVAPARRIVLERTWLRLATRSGLDVLHHPGGTVPFVSPIPTVVTLHDLQPLDDPMNFGGVKQRFLERSIPQAVERADLIATPSDWVGADVVRRFSLSSDRVRTVSAYAAPASTGYASSDPSSGSETGRVGSIVAAGPMVLYPAMTMRHKNHHLLFRAFNRALDERPELQLVCVGAVGRDHEEISAAARSTSTRIHVLGHVSQAELEQLYSAADMVVFPSLYEGFGLPVIEAQVHGVPVVVSTATALPEVAGVGARLIDPKDVTGWADALANPLRSAARDQAIAAGRHNASRYSAELTAAQQRGVYGYVTQ